MYPPTIGNAVIDLLLDSDSDTVRLLLRSAARVNVEAGTYLQRSGAPIEFAYFPLSGMVSLAWVLEEGSWVTTFGIGRDGAVHATPGIILDEAAHHVRAELATCALKIPVVSWQRYLDGDDQAKRLLTRYGESLLARSQQALACCTRHDAESRLCHWLLDMYGWQDGKPLTITHQSLANLLGLRRTTVTLMARSLQDAGIIAYRRGRIEVTDPYALQQASCECYKLRGTWQRILRETLTHKEPMERKATAD